MSCTSISSFVRRAASKSYIRNKSRCFSISAPRRIMETSSFTSEQLTVREAISKICSNFPDVRFLQFLHYLVDNWRGIGVLGPPWWVWRVPSWTSRGSGERWLDRNCVTRRAWRCRTRYIRGYDDASYNFWVHHFVCENARVILKRM